MDVLHRQLRETGHRERSDNEQAGTHDRRHVR
jgi:hypothetical protein